MTARIFRPAPNAMQSGRANSAEWVLEYELETPRRPEPVMGWVSSGDTLNQMKLRFETQEEAIAFAKKEGFDYAVELPHTRKVKPQSYLDNFKYIPPEEKKA